MMTILEYLQTKNNYVLFPEGQRYFYLFLQPQRTIIARKPDQVFSALKQLEKYLARGKYLAGFFSYELGYCLEKKVGQKKSNFPYLWFGVYPRSFIWDIARSRFRQPPADFSRRTGLSEYLLTNFSQDTDYPDYYRQVWQIKKFIRRGAVYQVNLTFKKNFDFYGSPLSLFFRLQKTQPALYSGLIHYDDIFILSCSPELFFSQCGDILTMRPMKGTAGRNNPEELLNLKNRSENLMIVDLLRNDLGKIARNISVPKLFQIEKYPTLNQMTSTIKARIFSKVGPQKIIQALFPSGSVTGAPKLAAMKIIRQLEKNPRKIYTGAIGYFSPENKANFNVTIRTILLDNKNHRAELGIGSGIVIDSVARREYSECQLKARFLEMARNNFQLIETIFGSAQTGFWLEKYHWQRLKHSAEVFRIPLSYNYWQKTLDRIKKQFQPGKGYRCRILLNQDGRLTGFLSEFKKRPEILWVKLSPVRRWSGDFLLRHKTSLRQIYEAEYQEARAEGFSEVIFANENGEITEGSRTNIFLRKGNLFFTPPLECGLLPGTLRQYLLDKYPGVFRQKIIKIADWFSAEEIFLGNSLFGLIPAIPVSFDPCQVI